MRKFKVTEERHPQSLKGHSYNYVAGKTIYCSFAPVQHEPDSTDEDGVNTSEWCGFPPWYDAYIIDENGDKEAVCPFYIKVEEIEDDE